MPRYDATFDENVGAARASADARAAIDRLRAPEIAAGDSASSPIFRRVLLDFSF